MPLKKTIFTQNVKTTSKEPTWDDFVKSGFDVKGQAQYYMAMTAVDASAKVGFDAGSLILPGLLTLKLGAEGTIKRGRTAMRLLTRMPESYVLDTKPVAIERPILFTSLYGYVRGVSGGLSAEASIGVDIALGSKKTPEKISGAQQQMVHTTGGVAGQKAAQKVDDATKKKFGPDSEILSASLTLKAEAMASLAGGAQHIFVSDRLPGFYSVNELETLHQAYETRRVLDGRQKADIKTEVEQLIPGQSKTFGHKGTEDLLMSLSRAYLGLKAEDRAKAYILYIALQTYRTDFTLGRGSFLRLAGGVVTSDAKVGARAGVEFTVAGTNRGVGVEATAVDYSGAGARTSYRIQLPAHLGESVLMMTQDTMIDYAQLDLKAFELAYGETRKGAISGKKGTGYQTAYNTMRYRSSVLYWHEGALNKGTTAVGRGSGLCLGVSLTLATLRELVRFSEVSKANDLEGHDASLKERVPALARSLGVADEELVKFLNEIKGLLFNYLYDPDSDEVSSADVDCAPSALLIEAAWGLKEPSPEVKLKAFGKGGGEPDEQVLKTLLQQFAQPEARSDKGNFALNSIKLRYRIADTSTETNVKFRLGFDFVASLGIELRSVEEICASGIVDLHTTWFNEMATLANDGEKQTELVEKSVPAVILLHQ